DADAKMPGHLEDADRHNGGFILFAKQLEESFGIAASKPEREAGKNHGAGRRMKAFDVAARIEEGVEQGAIGGEERASAFAKLLKMVEGHQGKALGGMGPGGGKQIIEEPHAAGELGSGQNPTAAQPAEAVDFREAAGNDERIFAHAGDRIADGEAERRRLAEEHLEVDLVHKHTHPGAMSHLADGLKHFRGEKRAEGGLLDEDFVAGIEQRGHCQVVRHGGARRRDHALLGDTGVLGKTALERGVTVIAGRGDFEFVEVHREFAARNAEEAARREIVFGVRSGLGPFHVQRTLRASGTAHALVASRLLLLARQKKYTGKPATAMSRPIVERRGSWAKVLRTTSHSAAMNSKVVQG